MPARLSGHAVHNARVVSQVKLAERARTKARYQSLAMRCEDFPDRFENVLAQVYP